MTDIHKLLQRQLRRNKSSLPQSEENKDFLLSVSEVYDQYDQEISLLERSLYLISAELNERNTLLKSQLEELTETKNQLKGSLSVVNATFDATGEIILVYDITGKLASINKMGEEFFEANNIVDFNDWAGLLSIFKYPKNAQKVNNSLRESPLQSLAGVVELTTNFTYEYRSLPQIINNVLVGRVWCLRDVTQQRATEELIQHQAYHDALTGLPNRILLLDRVEHAVALAKREERQIAVVFVDLDNFKRVNDTEGHKAGDELLIMLVKRIQSRLREQDTLARLGGDEFVILLEGITQQGDVTVLCKELLLILNEPFVINGRQHFVTLSLGVSLFPEHDANPEQLILKADMAMYKAKEEGKNTFEFYNKKLESKAFLQVKIERELREALNANELETFFQPKIELATGRIVGAELLIRWFKADKSSVPPDIFIPVAESTGLITHIGKMVIDSAIKHLKYWHSKGIVDLKLAVNLSVIEFQDTDLIQHLIDTVDANEDVGSQLIIELTESIFMEDKDRIRHIMERLSTRGVSFALDDFGKGYSSFSYLQILPIDYLKIDKSFLQNVTRDKQSAAIARTIIDVGHNLELDVIAEGIEDQETLDYVTKERCSMAQGYFLHRPMSSEEFNKLVFEQAAKSK
ncbi:MAG: diguanylate cyclase (GGDEF)-like protein [Glaciecola sp.]